MENQSLYSVDHLTAEIPSKIFGLLFLFVWSDGNNNSLPNFCIKYSFVNSHSKKHLRL